MKKRASLHELCRLFTKLTLVNRNGHHHSKTAKTLIILEIETLQKQSPAQKSINGLEIWQSRKENLESKTCLSKTVNLKIVKNP